jgi:amino acid transporter
MPSTIRRLLLGRPLETKQLAHEKLSNFLGLAVFAADAVSSTAYATEEILLALMVAGTVGMQYSMQVALAIAALIFIVVISYRQVVYAYPEGGGSYVVSRENLGPVVAQVAGAALMTDYLLTVAVSTSSGIAAVISALPSLAGYRIELTIGAILFMMLANLRGVRESARLFAVFAYSFIGIMVILLGLGLYRWATDSLIPVPQTASAELLETFGLFLFLKAFASGCSALTGIEAVSNGVQAFREPVARNAARVLTLLGLVLGALFLGATFLARELQITPLADQTVISQIGRAVLGDGLLYFILQFSTCIILIIAANTCFNGFPRLAAIQAADGYLPRQLTNLGDKLVFSNGILALGIAASLLVLVFKAETHSLIPLYAVGVFLAFTLSQAGMVVHWLKERGSAWQFRLGINALGTLTTGVVMCVILVEKFLHGAWVVALLVPILVFIALRIHKHYVFVAKKLSLEGATGVKQGARNLVIVPVAGMHRGVLKALQYALTLSSDVRAVHIEIEGSHNPRVQQMWENWAPEVLLEVVQSPYRELATPLLEYAQKAHSEEGFDYVTILVSEFVTDSPWEAMLHNHSALWLQFALRNEPKTPVLSLRYSLEELDEFSLQIPPEEE